MSGHSYFMPARGGWEAAFPWVVGDWTLPYACARRLGSRLSMGFADWTLPYACARRLGSRLSMGCAVGAMWKLFSDGFLDVPDEGAEAEHRAVFVESL